MRDARWRLMERSGFVWGAIGAFAFAGSLMVLMPPTSLKADWRPAAARPTMGTGVAAEPSSEPVSYAPTPQLYHLAYDPREDAAADGGLASADPEMREEMAVAAHDRAYGDGYGWAADRGLRDADSCRALHGDRRDGCMDYVASL